MSELLFRTGLQGWYKAPDALLTGTNPWKDSSGNSRNLVNTNIPLTSPSNGLPYWACDGSTTKMLTGVQLQTLLSAGAKTIFCAFNAHAITGTDVNVYNNESLVLTAGGFVGMCFRNNSGVYQIASYMNGTGFGGGADYAVVSGLTLDTWHVGIYAQNSGTLYCFLDDPVTGVTHATGTQTAAGWTTATLNLGVNLGSTLFHNGRLGELLFFNSFLAEQDRATVFNYLAAKWSGRGDPLEQMRDLGSRRTWMLGYPRMHTLLDDISIATPLPTNPLSDTQETFISHPRGLTPDGTGWGERLDWQPRPGRPEELTLDFEKCTRTLRVADLRPYRHSLIDSGKATVAGLRREGCMVGGAGVQRVFTRDSVGYYLDPGDGYTIVKAVTDQEQTSGYGLILGPPRTNQMLRSSFVSGLTGLGAVVGTGTIALDTTDLVFDPAITPNSLKFTYGGTDLYRTWPITTGTAFGSSAGVQNFFLYQKVSAPGEYLQVQIQRSVDSLWLQSNGTWGAAAQWFPAAAPASEDQKLTVFQIDFGVSATNITVRIGFPSGGTSGRTANLYHVECCAPNAGWVPLGGLFVVTDAAVASAAEDQLAIRLLQATGPLGPATFLDAQTVAFKYSVASFGVNVPEIHIGALDSVVTTDGWAFNVPAHPYGFSARTGGATVTAVGVTPTYAGGSSALSDHRVVLRRISSHGDLGLAAGTLDVFIDGAKGTTAVEGSAPSPSDYRTFWSRGGSSSNPNASIINSLIASPYAWTDAECMAWGL